MKSYTNLVHTHFNHLITVFASLWTGLTRLESTIPLLSSSTSFANCLGNSCSALIPVMAVLLRLMAPSTVMAATPVWLGAVCWYSRGKQLDLVLSWSLGMVDSE